MTRIYQVKDSRIKLKDLFLIYIKMIQKLLVKYNVNFNNLKLDKEYNDSRLRYKHKSNPYDYYIYSKLVKDWFTTEVEAGIEELNLILTNKFYL